MSMKIDEEKALKAFRALYKHEAKHGEGEEVVWLMVTTYRKNLLVKNNINRIVLKHGCHTPGVHRCLFIRAKQDEYKKILKEKKIKGIHKVIDVKHFKKLYRSPEAQLKLMEEFDMFMADRYTRTKLSKIFSKEMHKKRREPIPIDLRKTDLQKEVLRAAKSTYMNFQSGSCYAVRIATTGQSEQIAFENFMGAYKKIAMATPGKERAIRSLQIKTANSVSLPVYDADTDYVREEGYQTDDEVL
ncbi:ribosomal protein L1/ribosomal biogenesis protein [Pilobolus umbonatus]|nr:ribosomal protein L1/ribosomal biogenesis protein [Pilobolus umbonatus]